jgi:DNA-binding NarL/FixJ family response regulator
MLKSLMLLRKERLTFGIGQEPIWLFDTRKATAPVRSAKIGRRTVPDLATEFDGGSFMLNAAPITVLIIDDHPLMRDGIAFSLEARADMQVVGQAKDGVEGLALYLKHLPAVTLVDLQMPRMNGIQTISEIRKHNSKARLIVLTTYSGDAQVVRAIKAGASGYVLKNMLRQELIDTVIAVHAGLRRVPPELAAEIVDHVDADDLTPREIEILRIVASGNANKAVATHFGLSEETVKGHMKNILAKLGANDRTHAVMIALKRGFLDG